jgi:DNA repair protein RadC
MREQHISIKNWSNEEQPREKFLQKGKSALTNAELLAILINTGTANKSALDIARDILQLANNNLLELGRITIDDLKTIKGLGNKKAVTIAAALELGNRRQSETALEKSIVRYPKQAYDILKPLLADKTHEEVYVLYLNQAYKLESIEKLSSGGITGTIVDVRMILKKALSFPTVTKLVLAHNHPSGSLQVSETDILVTEKLRKAAKQLDYKLEDHIIIAGDSFYSFAENEKL